MLHSGPLNPNVRVEPAQIHDLAQFWLRNYDVVCVDLSGNLERYSLEILRDSQQVFLVCTPEVPSLHLTREKLAFLKTLDLDSRVSVVLNRVSKQSLLTPQQVQDVLGVPVMHNFINDYQVVNTATRAGEFVDPKSKLGLQFAELAGQPAQPVDGGDCFEAQVPGVPVGSHPGSGRHPRRSLPLNRRPFCCRGS